MFFHKRKRREREKKFFIHAICVKGGRNKKNPTTEYWCDVDKTEIRKESDENLHNFSKLLNFKSRKKARNGKITKKVTLSQYFVAFFSSLVHRYLLSFRLTLHSYNNANDYMEKKKKQSI